MRRVTTTPDTLLSDLAPLGPLRIRLHRGRWHVTTRRGTTVSDSLWGALTLQADNR